MRGKLIILTNIKRRGMPYHRQESIRVVSQEAERGSVGNSFTVVSVGKNR